jgi:hypothetical protein
MCPDLYTIGKLKGIGVGVILRDGGRLEVGARKRTPELPAPIEEGNREIEPSLLR